MPQKELLVVAGPNGSGKSTFVTRLLEERPRPYLCADLIALEFPQLDEISRQLAAGREFIQRIESQIAAGENFVVETTMSGRTLRSHLQRAKQIGFEITIVFVYLNSDDTSVARVRERVRRGGHNVPEADIRRRFRRCFQNFWHRYRQIADYWHVYYNFSRDFKPVASGQGDAILVRDASAFDRFLQFAEDVSDAENKD
jgi:predicted ABC-type ATPase